MPSPPYRTVLADDNATTRRFMKALVERHQCTVVAEATNGEEAVTATRMTKPDLVLLDVNMPLMTGSEALPAILAARPGVAVVMLTSVSDAETVQDCLAKGAINFIRKDAGTAELGSLITQTLAMAFGTGAP